MQLIGGMTIKQLLDKSHSMGELNSDSYPRWVNQVMNCTNGMYLNIIAAV